MQKLPYGFDDKAMGHQDAPSTSMRPLFNLVYERFVRNPECKAKINN